MANVNTLAWNNTGPSLLAKAVCYTVVSKFNVEYII